MKIRIGHIVVLAFVVATALSCEEDSTYLNLQEESVTTNNEETKKNHDAWCIKNNQWIYKQMIHHYFWNYDIPDSASLDYTLSPPSFFSKLKSDKDRFSWCELNESYKGDTLEKVLEFEYQPYIDANGQSINQIILCNHNITRKYPQIKRGTWCKWNEEEVNILKIVTGEIKDGAFCATDTVDYNMVRDDTRGTNLNFTVSLDSVYMRGDRRIGYFVYDEYESEADLTDIFIKLKRQRVNELIVDVRYNHGGYVKTAQKLCSLILPSNYLGDVFCYLRYNNIITQERRMANLSTLKTEYLNSDNNTRARNLNLERVFFLTTKSTASSSELTINALRPYMQVTTIGQTTCGKDVGSYTLQDNNYKYQLQPITFRYYNSLLDSVPQSGIIPDISASENARYELGDTCETLLNIALNYITNPSQDCSREIKANIYPQKRGANSIEKKHLTR